MPILALIQRLPTRRPTIVIGTSIDGRNGMEIFSDALNEIEAFTTLQRLAWGLNEVSS